MHLIILRSKGVKKDIHFLSVFYCIILPNYATGITMMFHKDVIGKTLKELIDSEIN